VITDCIVVLNRGRLEQLGSPVEIDDAPCSLSGGPVWIRIEPGPCTISVYPFGIIARRGPNQR
jgi:hypothetical protein